MQADIINDALVAIKNAEAVGKSEIILKPTSKLLTGILKLMQQSGYVGDFEYTENNRGGEIKLKLVHKINKCGVIKPRFSVKKNDFEKWEQRYLPARDFGILLVSTSQGLMTHNSSKEKDIGGRLIAYVY
jgi:small subunit ribosomal protein S8